MVVRSGKVEQIKCRESYESRDKDNENFAEDNDFRRKNEELSKKGWKISGKIDSKRKT